VPKDIRSTSNHVLKKIDGARIIRDAVHVHDVMHGSWEALDLPGGGEARVRTIDAGLGWSGIITSPFSGIPCDPAMRNHANGNAMNNQVVMDLYSPPVGRFFQSLLPSLEMC
jgi:hypothetical protein